MGFVREERASGKVEVIRDTLLFHIYHIRRRIIVCSIVISPSVASHFYSSLPQVGFILFDGSTNVTNRDFVKSK